MLFKPGSINEDVTLGALVMFSFSSHHVLSSGPSNRPPLTGPILETLTTDLSDATGPEATGCLSSYACCTSGEPCVGLRREARLRALTAPSFHGKQKRRGQCSLQYCRPWLNVRLRLRWTKKDRSQAVRSAGTDGVYPVLTEAVFPAAVLDPDT